MCTGKVEKAEYEMKRYDIHIVGITEMRWKGYGSVKHHDYTKFYSGSMDNKRNEVGFNVHNSLSKFVLSCEMNNSEMMLICLSSEPFSLRLIQVPAPTNPTEEEETEEFYSTLEQMIVNKPCRQDIIIIFGDFNAKTGKKNIMETETGLYWTESDEECWTMTH